jgi:hypothetical protein
MTDQQPTWEDYFPSGDSRATPATKWFPPPPPEDPADRRERQLGEQLDDMQRLLDVIQHPEKLRPQPEPEPTYEDFFPHSKETR